MTSQFIQPFFIGLAGPDGVGKSTVQQAIRQLDWRTVGRSSPDVVVRPMSFATRLYEAVSAMFGVPIPEIKARKNEVFTNRTAPHPSLVGKSWRFILRDFATEYVRDRLSSEHWVNCVLNDAPKIAEAEYTKHVVVVLDDLRFPNEVGICDLVVELERDGVVYDGQHRSSQGLPKELIDVTAKNNGPATVTAELIGWHATDRFRKARMYHDAGINQWIDCVLTPNPMDEGEKVPTHLGLTVRDERYLDAQDGFQGLSFRQWLALNDGKFCNLMVQLGAPRTRAWAA